MTKYVAIPFEPKAIEEEWRTKPTDLAGWANRAAAVFATAKRMQKRIVELERDNQHAYDAWVSLTEGRPS